MATPSFTNKSDEIVSNYYVGADNEKGQISGIPADASASASDVEKQSAASDIQGTTVELKRRLKSRHLQMIAIGGTIGTGLFIGSGGALATAGPGGALIAYIFVGTLVYSVMVALGELATFLPVGAFTVFPTRLIDPSLGFATSWIYWFSWAITYALELTATGLIIEYWIDTNIGIWIGVFWAVITAVNFLPVSFYGEIEFYFSLIKIITVLGFLIFGICIDAGASPNGQGYLGFKYWGSPWGAFVAYTGFDDRPALGKFVSFWSVLIQAGFSYQGTELVGIAAAETYNPRKTVPAAIRKTFYRILFFFVGTVFFIGLLVPYTDSNLSSSGTNATSSPLVIAANLAGVAVLPGLINAVLLTVVLSAANSNVYSGSRILVNMASDGCAPGFFSRTTSAGVPFIAVAFTAAFGLLGFLNLSASGDTAFNWLYNISGVAGFIAWTSILASSLQFRRVLKSRGISRDSLPYKAPFQPWLSWYGLVFNVIIVLTQGFTNFFPTFDVSGFFVAYISVILFVVLWVGHKLVFRQPFISLRDADIDTGRAAIEHMDLEIEDEPPKTVLGKIGAWLG
ncbi:hypothetical protein MRB53_037745 [Persea americana]|nr:hypothetical protein MRB53_037745 [Persea americana]